MFPANSDNIHSPQPIVDLHPSQLRISMVSSTGDSYIRPVRRNHSLFGLGDLMTTVPLCLTCFARCPPRFIRAFNGVFPALPPHRLAPCVSSMCRVGKHNVRHSPDSCWGSPRITRAFYSETELLSSVIPSPSSSVRMLIKGPLDPFSERVGTPTVWIAYSVQGRTRVPTWSASVRAGLRILWTRHDASYG